MIEWEQDKTGHWIRRDTREEDGLVRSYPQNRIDSWDHTPDVKPTVVSEERQNRFDRFRKVQKRVHH